MCSPVCSDGRMRTVCVTKHKPRRTAFCTMFGAGSRSRCQIDCKCKVVSISPVVEARNTKIRLLGHSFTQLIEVGDRIPSLPSSGRTKKQQMLTLLHLSYTIRFLLDSECTHIFLHDLFVFFGLSIFGSRALYQPRWVCLKRCASEQLCLEQQRLLLPQI